MRTHELWRERLTGEVWAIELREGMVTGCLGPLAHEDVDHDLLDRYDYTGERADWIEQHRGEFDLYGPVAV